MTGRWKYSLVTSDCNSGFSLSGNPLFFLHPQIMGFLKLKSQNLQNSKKTKKNENTDNLSHFLLAILLSGVCTMQSTVSLHVWQMSWHGWQPVGLDLTQSKPRLCGWFQVNNLAFSRHCKESRTQPVTSALSSIATVGSCSSYGLSKRLLAAVAGCLVVVWRQQ